MLAKRKQRLVVKVTKGEKSFVWAASKTARKTPSDFIRDAVFRAASEINNGGQPKTEPYAIQPADEATA